jgi:hypothetical protein
MTLPFAITIIEEVGSVFSHAFRTSSLELEKPSDSGVTVSQLRLGLLCDAAWAIDEIRDDTSNSRKKNKRLQVIGRIIDEYTLTTPCEIA